MCVCVCVCVGVGVCVGVCVCVCLNNSSVFFLLISIRIHITEENGVLEKNITSRCA